MDKKTIWFMEGYSNIYHAIMDIKNMDTENNFSILCTHSRPKFIGFVAADFHEQEPILKGEKFIEYCKKIVKKYNVKVIYAFHNQKILNKFAEEFEKIGAVIATAANHKNYDIINNKGNLYKKLFNKNILRVPNYKLITPKDCFSEIFMDMKKTNPLLCVKPVIGVYGEGFELVSEKNEFNKIGTNVNYKDYEKILKQQKNNILLMQYLEGNERSVDALAYKGDLIGAVSRIKIKSPKHQLIENNPELIEQVKKMVKHLNINGMFNVQFKDFKNQQYLLEINPRLSGRAYYATEAGFNIPYFASQVFSGLKKPDEIQYQIKYGLKLYGRKAIPSNHI